MRVLFRDFDLAPLRRAVPQLASVICVDVGVALSPRNGYIREAVVDQPARFSRCPH